MGVTEEEFRAAIARGRSYAVAFLVDGPNSQPDDRAEVQLAHAMRNYQLHLDGVMNVVGPIASDNRVRGICIIDGSLERAAEVLDGDPAIQAGIFSYELLELFSFPGSTLAD